MRRILTSLLIVGVVASLIAGSALALWTDTETSPNSAFTTGTLDLTLDPTTALFTVTGMAPGDVEYSGLEVANPGTLGLRYAMTTTPDGASILDEQLDLTIDVVTGPGPDTFWYTDDDIVGEANVYGPDGVLSAAAIGDPTAGFQAGDRTLASGSERLRFKVTLPIDTDNSYQGTTCTVSFVFDAEQTKNNP